MGEIRDMNSAILRGTPNELPMTDSRRHIQTALALYQAAATGERVRLEPQTVD